MPTTIDIAIGRQVTPLARRGHEALLIRVKVNTGEKDGSSVGSVSGSEVTGVIREEIDCMPKARSFDVRVEPGDPHPGERGPVGRNVSPVRRMMSPNPTTTIFPSGWITRSLMIVSALRPDRTGSPGSRRIAREGDPREVEVRGRRCRRTG